MATLHAKGELPLHQDFRHQGLLGNIYTGRLINETSIGGNEAVVPTITGKSWIYGLNTFVLDHDDPFPEGFTIGDIWARAQAAFNALVSASRAFWQDLHLKSPQTKTPDHVHDRGPWITPQASRSGYRQDYCC